MKVMVKNGKVGTLVGDCHVIFDNHDGYSHTVPANDIVKVWNDKEFKEFMEEVNETSKGEATKVVPPPEPQLPTKTLCESFSKKKC